MQITVPNNGTNPIIIAIGGVSYKLGAGETLTVPDEIAIELNRKLAAETNAAPAVDLPFSDKGANLAIAGILTRLAAVEAAVAVKELPELPDTDGTYGLQLVVDNGTGTLTWEAAEDFGGGGSEPQ